MKKNNVEKRSNFYLVLLVLIVVVFGYFVLYNEDSSTDEPSLDELIDSMAARRVKKII